MSAYNILRAECICSHCHKKYNGILQFKYGDIWQNEYQIGDKIKWGGNDIGIANVQKVKVYGILETDTCNWCNEPNNDNEFDIHILNNIIKGIDPLTDYKDYLETEGCYKIIDN